MSKEGFKNENELATYLTGKVYANLNTNMQHFLKYMYPNISDNDVIYSDGYQGSSKGDIWIQVNDKKFNISIKSGQGNSVHQEPLEEFIIFLQKNYKISKYIANNIRFFIWGDNTFDGTGRKEDRKSATTLKKNYPKIIKDINDFFNPIKKDLILRFVVNGAEKSTISADYVYYGNVDNGLREAADLLVEKIVNDKKGTAVIPIGALTFQAWNRAVGVDTKTNTEKKRGVIQLKFPGIKKYLIQ